MCLLVSYISEAILFFLPVVIRLRWLFSQFDHKIEKKNVFYPLVIGLALLQRLYAKDIRKVQLPHGSVTTKLICHWFLNHEVRQIELKWIKMSQPLLEVFSHVFAWLYTGKNQSGRKFLGIVYSKQRKKNILSVN